MSKDSTTVSSWCQLLMRRAPISKWLGCQPIAMCAHTRWKGIYSFKCKDKMRGCRPRAGWRRTWSRDVIVASSNTFSQRDIDCFPTIKTPRNSHSRMWTNRPPLQRISTRCCSPHLKPHVTFPTPSQRSQRSQRRPVAALTEARSTI